MLQKTEQEWIDEIYAMYPPHLRPLELDDEDRKLTDLPPN